MVLTASGGQQRASAIHTYVSILPQSPLPSRLPHNAEQSSLCWTAGPCWSSILNTAEYTSIPNSLTIPFPHPPHRQPQRGLSNRAVRIPRAASGCAILSTPLSCSLLSYKMGMNSCTKPAGLLWQWNWTRTVNARLVQARPWLWLGQAGFAKPPAREPVTHS